MLRRLAQATLGILINFAEVFDGNYRGIPVALLRIGIGSGEILMTGRADVAMTMVEEV